MCRPTEDLRRMEGSARRRMMIGAHKTAATSIETFRQAHTNLRTTALLSRRLSSWLAMLIVIASTLTQMSRSNGRAGLPFVGAHVVLTRDDQGQSLVLTGEDSKKEDGEQVVISGNNLGGGGQSSNMIMQDAANRAGDIVMNGRSMIIPGEDGHIVLADSRRNDDDLGPPAPSRPAPNPFMFWAPYMGSRMLYRMMPFFG